MPTQQTHNVSNTQSHKHSAMRLITMGSKNNSWSLLLYWTDYYSQNSESLIL